MMISFAPTFTPASWCLCADILDKFHEALVPHQQIKAAAGSRNIDHSTVITVLQTAAAATASQVNASSSSSSDDLLILLHTVSC